MPAWSPDSKPANWDAGLLTVLSGRAAVLLPVLPAAVRNFTLFAPTDKAIQQAFPAFQSLSDPGNPTPPPDDIGCDGYCCEGEGEYYFSGG